MLAHADPLAPVLLALAIILALADIGAGLTLHGQPVIGPTSFSAVVAMVVGTTMITPPALKWSLNRDRRREVVAAAPPDPARTEGSLP